MRWPDIEPDPDPSIWLGKFDIFIIIVLVGYLAWTIKERFHEETAAPTPAGMVAPGGQCPGVRSGEDHLPSQKNKDGDLLRGSDGQAGDGR